MDPTTEPKEKKKKPVGRPRKKIVVLDDPKGIVDTPVNKDSFMELAFIQINLLKTLFTMFNSMVIKAMVFNFDIDKINIFISDEHDNMNMSLNISGEKVFSYYCQEPFSITVYYNELNQLLKNLEKNYWSKIMFQSIKSTRNSIIQLMFERSELNMFDIHPIKISKDISSSDVVVPHGKKKLQFTLPAEDFKIMIAKVKRIGDERLTIERFNKKLLKLIFTKKTGVDDNIRVLKNDEKIKLISDLDEGELFTATIKVDTIQPFSASQLCRDVVWTFYENQVFTLTGKIKSDAKNKAAPELMDITFTMRCIS